MTPQEEKQLAEDMEAYNAWLQSEGVRDMQNLRDGKLLTPRSPWEREAVLGTLPKPMRRRILAALKRQERGD